MIEYREFRQLREEVRIGGIWYDFRIECEINEPGWNLSITRSIDGVPLHAAGSATLEGCKAAAEAFLEKKRREAENDTRD